MKKVLLVAATAMLLFACRKYDLQSNAFSSVNENNQVNVQIPIADTFLVNQNLVTRGKTMRIETASLQKVIYLDLDGHTVTSPEWIGLNYGQSFFVSGVSLDASQIDIITRKLKEDFSHCDNVKVVLTEAEFLQAPIRQRVVYTTQSTVFDNVFGALGGIAQLYSFFAESDVPCFVFANHLSMNAKYMALASSHEAGHGFGLIHSPIGLQGTGTLSWAPIMSNTGTNYYAGVTTWARGMTTENTYQDEFEIAYSGFGENSDDAGNTIECAHSLVLSQRHFGERETTDDADMLKYTWPTNQSFQIKFSGLSGGNIDLRVIVYKKNSLGNLVQVKSIDQTTGLNVPENTFSKSQTGPDRSLYFRVLASNRGPSSVPPSWIPQNTSTGTYSVLVKK